MLLLEPYRSLDTSKPRKSLSLERILSKSMGRLKLTVVIAERIHPCWSGLIFECQTLQLQQKEGGGCVDSFDVMNHDNINNENDVTIDATGSYAITPCYALRVSHVLDVRVGLIVG
jgi:hypothetical protein